VSVGATAAASAAAAATAVAEPAEATRPPEARGLARDGVRMLAASPARLRHARFGELPELLTPGDAIVVNTSATLPASLPARRSDGSAITLNLSTPVPHERGDHWIVELRRGGARARDATAGELLNLPGGARAELLAPYLGRRLWIAAFDLPLSCDVIGYLGRHGQPIRYRHLDGDTPLETHQTVFAGEPGSAEMPSAGRPFTPALVTRLVARGVDVIPVVLHTGVSSLELGEPPYAERFEVPAHSAGRINGARWRGGRVIAVGTTVVRALESAATDAGTVEAAGGWTELVIGPERPVRTIDGLLTGFHDSDSSHLRMLAAFAGEELVARSQRAAARAGYLRHEFGDVQLLLP
jgi:S-adenosylmethionine:tRNA ribosyltransferase-isomerase